MSANDGMSRLTRAIPPILAVALGFGGGHLLGNRPADTAVPAASLPYAAEAPSTKELDSRALLDEASSADNTALTTLLARHSGDRRHRDLLVLLLAEKDPRQALAFLTRSWQENRDASLLALCGSAFRQWAAKAPEEAIAALDVISDMAIRSHAIHGTLDSLFATDPVRAGEVLVKWGYDLGFDFPFPNWFDGDPAAGLALFPHFASSHLGSQMRWKLPERWAKSDPVGAISWLESHPDSGLRGTISSAVHAWVETDLDAAEAALRAGRFNDPVTIRALEKAVLTARAQENPREALAAIAANLTGDERRGGITGSVRKWAQQDLPAALEWTMAQADGEVRGMAFSSLAEEWADADAPSAAAFALTHLSLSPMDSDPQFQYLRSIADEYVRSSPEAALDWADRLPDAHRSNTESHMLGILLAQDQAAAIAEASKRLDRFSMHTVESFSRALFRRDPEAAVQWLASLPEGESAELVRNGFGKAGRLSEVLKSTDH